MGKRRGTCLLRLLSVSYPRIEPPAPLSPAPHPAPTRGLSVSYPRIEPPAHAIWLSPRLKAKAFSILPSDRTTCTLRARRGRRVLDALSVSYPRIEPPAPPILQQAFADEVRAFSILPSDRTTCTRSQGLCGAQDGSSFQYPTLGSNHLHPRPPHTGEPLAVQLSVSYPRIEPPAPGIAGLLHLPGYSTFSILPSDRTTCTSGLLA